VTALATTADLRLGLAETKAGFWRYRVVVALAIQAVAIIGTVVALVHSVAHG
jgi:anti-sigma-K factor RskA